MARISLEKGNGTPLNFLALVVKEIDEAQTHGNWIAVKVCVREIAFVYGDLLNVPVTALLKPEPYYLRQQASERFARLVRPSFELFKQTFGSVFRCVTMKWR